jgi:hypothetical protein
LNENNRIEETKEEYTIVFVSKNFHTNKNGLYIVGFYLNAKIFKRLQNNDSELDNYEIINSDKRPYRVVTKNSQNVYCVPNNKRFVNINDMVINKKSKV